MTNLVDFARLARGQKTVATEYSRLPDTNSPGVALSALFLQQSYFDSTLLQNAILVQTQNEPIVATTARDEQLSGYAIGLHPSSQTPVAIQPLVGGQPMSPQAIILRPGQVWRPYGKPDAGKPGNFSGFSWGLPFGWLGGGLATLYVLRSHDAEVWWPGTSPEIIFQRQTMAIVAPSSLAEGFPVAGTAARNWPLRFPWTQAQRGAANISQKGAAIVNIADPTRIEMSLQLGALTAPADMRMLFQGTNDFDLDATGAVIATPVRFVDVTWGQYAGTLGTGNLATQYPIMEITGGPVCRMAADDGGVVLVDLNSTGDDPSLLFGAFCDVVRYGRL